ncbi:serine protease, degp/htra, do-like [hydrocarbon metagenome]|uniref:Serine protease, degp/htra, do-like n=1 Tax=hydrocarbon metagenome TaxID=938273 RepID=A0A0W8E218_9ZZZZ
MGRNTRLVIAFFSFFFIGLGTFWYVSQSYDPIEKSQSILSAEDQAYRGRISDVAAQVSPSIVGISNLSRDGGMFNQNIEESTGSGVILDSQGYIVTNNHVVEGADTLTVTLADGNEEQAEVVGADPQTDLAVIKVKVDNRVTPIRFGDSDQLAVGQEVIAIGNPLGLRFARSVTAGIVSGLNRLLTTEEGFLFRLIQTDAAINPGNSGGALVNLDGELIGINTIKIAETGFEGMGFSIPSNQVKAVIKELKDYGKVTRPLMGIKVIGEISQEKARYYELPIKGGVIIEPVSGGAADKAGLKAFDIIYALDGNEVTTGMELQGYVLGKKAGDSVRVTIIRLLNANAEQAQVQKRTVQVTLR